MVGRLFLLISFFFIASAGADSESSAEVGFLELRRWDGSVRRLEPDFPYGHIAIRVEDRWLHAHPLRGVEWVPQTELEKVGKLKIILPAHTRSPLTEAVARPLVGIPYDNEFSWTDEKMYCAELIAKILGIPPVAMHFDPELWPEPYLKLEGHPGISPGILYRWISLRAASSPHD